MSMRKEASASMKATMGRMLNTGGRVSGFASGGAVTAGKDPKRANGGRIGGGAASPRMDRANGGRVKDGKKTTVNVIVSGGQPGAGNPPPMPLPIPVPAAPPPPPDVGAAGPGLPGMGMGGGGGPPVNVNLPPPGPPPMMRQRGGRAFTGGAESGVGRLEQARRAK